MTGIDPADLHRLAELDADIAAGLAPDPGAGADPASRAVLDALAATRAELAALPVLPVPPGLTARWTATARVDETGTSSSPSEHGVEARPIAPAGQTPRVGGRVRRRVPWHPFPRTGASPEREAGTRPGPGGPSAGRRRRVRPALAVGVALAGLLIVAGVLQSRPAQPAVTAAQLGGFAQATVGTYDAGELADPVRRAGCLRSVAAPGLAPDAPLVGGRGVDLDGRHGILLVLGTGQLGRLRIAVVDPECGPGGGTLLADTVIGR